MILFLFMTSSLAASPIAEFKSAIEQMTEGSSQVLSQKYFVEAAEKNKRSSYLYWTPSASFNIYQPVPGAETGSPKGLNAEINLKLWNFGSSHLNYEASKSKLDAENARLNSAKQDFEMIASKLIFELIRQKKIIEIQKKHLNLKEESFQVARERYKQGQLASQELEKVKIELETSKINLSEAEIIAIDIQNSIQTIADRPLTFSDWPFENQLNQSKRFKYRIVTDFYKNHSYFSDFQYFKLKASSVLRENYTPSLHFAAKWNQSDLGPIHQGEWTAYFGITIPLWDRLEGSALASSFAANAKNSELLFEQSNREVKAKLSNLEKRLELTRLNVQASLRAAEKLQELRNDSLRRFRMGRSTVNDLLIDENRFLEAEASLLNAMLSYHILLVENCHAAEESINNCY